MVGNRILSKEIAMEFFKELPHSIYWPLILMATIVILGLVGVGIYASCKTKGRP
jgi:hypothetical protein